MTVDAIVRSFETGVRLTPETAKAMYVEAPTALLGRLADDVRRAKHPEGQVTYIIDRNVNYTNVCVARCRFCAFYRPVGSAEGYTLGFDEIHRKIDETIRLGGGQLLLQGGHNPDIPLQWYEDLFRSVKNKYPTFRLHALSPPEIIHISRLSQLPVPAVIERLVAAGLDSIPGGGAEILVDRVRKELNCYNKATADEWLDVMRHAHRAGLRTTATMMYGTVETIEERLEHLFRLRSLQDETGGFTAFIAWSYQPQHTELGGTEATGVDYLRTLAVARLVLDNFDNLQSSWVTQGGKVGQLSLAYGANDMGSVMIEENVVRAAGAEYLHGRVRGRAEYRERGLSAQAAQHALRRAGRSGVPGARSPAHAGARSCTCRWSSGRGAGPARLRRQEPGRPARARRAMIYRACWVLPIDRPPIEGGWIETQGERISRIGAGPAPSAVEDLGDVALLPGLVNAHTHLELAWMAGRVPPAASMEEWIRTLLTVRRAGPEGGDAEIRQAMVRAAADMFATGTVLAGDISNSLQSPPILIEAGIGGVVFHELLGFAEAHPARAVREAWERDFGVAGRSPLLGRRARAVFGFALAVQGNRSPHGLGSPQRAPR